MKLFKQGAILSSDKYIDKYTRLIDGKVYCGVIPSISPIGYYQYPYALVHELGLDYFDEVPNLNYIKDWRCKSTITLKDFQENAIAPFLSAPYGILYSAPGTGKTIMGVELIARTNYKTLVLVNSLFLLNQWADVIYETLGYKVGKLGGGHFEINDITISTFQTGRKFTSIFEDFSLVIVDECHHVPANTFRETLSNIPAFWKMGLTGTYHRKDELEFMANWYLGDRIIENLIDDTMTPEIVIVQTGIKIGSGTFVDGLTELAINNNLLGIIDKLVTKCQEMNRKQLVIPFRLSTVEILEELFPEAIVVIGETPEEDRADLNEKLLINNLIISTTLQEGADIPRLDTIHLIHPNNNLPMLEQRIKRICRTVLDKKTPLVFDYFFKDNSKAEYKVTQQQQIRLNFYKNKGYKIHVI